MTIIEAASTLVAHAQSAAYRPDGTVLILTTRAYLLRIDGGRKKAWQPRLAEILADDWQVRQIETQPGPASSPAAN